MPEIPTTRESGIPNLLGGFWFGLVAPAGTPSHIVEAINAAGNEAMQSRALQAAMEALGASHQPSTPAEFGKFISAETEKWTAIIRASGIKVE
jgi:tripartite-type tricarboxylate transporter receptor subunit TctC